VKASAIRYLIDAGPLVGALSSRDQWHTWSASVVATLDEPGSATEVVFGEACHLLTVERDVLLSDLHPKARVITTDTRHFTVYRRFGHERLPLIRP